MRGTSLAAIIGIAAAIGCNVTTYERPYDTEAPPDEMQPPEMVSDEMMPPSGPRPDFGAVRRHAAAPLSGGTLLATKDKTKLVAADPDRDRVFVVTPADAKVTTVTLATHDEPGRLVEDADGRVHVALRRGGAIATIELATGTILARRAVCPAPRGLAFDAANARILVACEGGEFVTMPPEPSGAPSLLAKPGRDLRDVIVSGDTIYVSRFRTAEILALGTSGAKKSAWRPQSLLDGPSLSTLAWRMIAGEDGGPMVVHQAASTAPVVVSTPSGYGQSSSQPNDCNTSGIVHSVVSTMPGGSVRLPTHAVLPIDIALDGSSMAIIAAGNGHTQQLPQLMVVDRTNGGCGERPFSAPSTSGQLTSVAALGKGEYAVLSREPAQIQLVSSGVVIPLADDSVEDTGHAVFHSNSGAGIACASCHGEGGDDGHVWNFDAFGARRTPSLRGTIAGTAPYHWDGLEADISQLAADVLVRRMNGPSLSSEQSDALRGWLFDLPAPAATSLVDSSAAARGKAIFARADVKCATCHAGDKLASPDTVDVGTGGAFQVPSLVGVGLRTPLLHDGCASTMEERFSKCGSTLHGNTSKLSSTELGDLIAYLQSL